MRPEQVKALLGEPSQTQFIANEWVWKYSLLEPWKGFIPYYLVFSQENPMKVGMQIKMNIIASKSCG